MLLNYRLVYSLFQLKGIVYRTDQILILKEIVLKKKFAIKCDKTVVCTSSGLDIKDFSYLSEEKSPLH